MKLSAQSDYALRIVLYLSKFPGNRLASEVVEACQIPRSLGLKIVTLLVHNNILKSSPGKNGGISLIRKPEEISVYSVICTIERLEVKDCTDDPTLCSWRKGKCSVCLEMKNIKNDFISKLKGISFKYLLEKENQLGL